MEPTVQIVIVRKPNGDYRMIEFNRKGAQSATEGPLKVILELIAALAHAMAPANDLS